VKNIDIDVKSENVCCIADLHIGVHQNSIFWHETAIKWANWLKGELDKKQIKDIFILGDLYHYRDEIAVNTIHVVNEILNIWSSFNIVVLVGNHDAFYKDRSDINSLSILSGWKNITVISETTLTTLYGKKCSFVPWGAGINKIEFSDIIFGHFEIESFKMNSHKHCDHGIKTLELLERASLVMTGHFHLREERQYDKRFIVYVGNPFEMDFGDIDSTKGYYILNISTQKFNFYENALSPAHKKILLSEITGKKISNKTDLKDIIFNNIVKIIIDKKISSDNIDVLIQKLSSYKPFSISVDYSLFDNSISVNDESNVDLSGVDMQKTIDEFINILDIDKKTDVSKYCIELYKKATSTS
jgi:DNA repair exonuclease SbcCD nuclease subunit